MTKTELDKEIKRLIESVNSIKSRLIDICDDMKDVSKVRADSLDLIIGRLEDWQHR